MLCWNIVRFYTHIAVICFVVIVALLFCFIPDVPKGNLAGLSEFCGICRSMGGTRDSLCTGHEPEMEK